MKIMLKPLVQQLLTGVCDQRYNTKQQVVCYFIENERGASNSPTNSNQTTLTGFESPDSKI